jgi:hypothetical protein
LFVFDYLVAVCYSIYNRRYGIYIFHFRLIHQTGNRRTKSTQEKGKNFQKGTRFTHSIFIFFPVRDSFHGALPPIRVLCLLDNRKLFFFFFFKKKEETFENKIKGKEITFYLLGISINKPHPILHSTHFYWIKKKRYLGTETFQEEKEKEKGAEMRK